MLQAYIKKLADICFAALPQVCGLLTQIIIIKLYAAPQVVDRLPIYNSAMAAISIIFLGMSYTRSRTVISLSTTMTIHLLSWLSFIIVYLTYGYGFELIAVASILVILCVSIIQLYLARGYGRVAFVLIASVVGILAPQILWLSGIGIWGVAIVMTLSTVAYREEWGVAGRCRAIALQYFSSSASFVDHAF
jgi:hypothetical protein